MKLTSPATPTSSVDATIFSGEVLFRVRLTESNIDLFVQAVKDGLIYDGSQADLEERLRLLANRIEQRHRDGHDYSRLEQEEDIIYAALQHMRAE